MEAKLLGLNEILNALKTLPAKLQANIIRGVLKDSAKVEAKNKIVEQLPYGKHKSLSKALTIAQGKNKTSVLVGVKDSEFIARFFERGTAERTSRGSARGRITAKPIIEYAIDERVDDVINYINDEFGNRIATHLEKKIKGAKKRNMKL